VRRTIEGSFGKANDRASEVADERKTLAEAVELFVATKRNANCSRDVAKGYDVELSRFVSFVAGLKPPRIFAADLQPEDLIVGEGFVGERFSARSRIFCRARFMFWGCGIGRYRAHANHRLA
jgi:hypothetical protein